MHCANPTTTNAKGADGKHRAQWSLCNVSVRLQPRLFPAAFSAYCPRSHFQFIQVHQSVLACAPSMNCLGCGCYGYGYGYG